MLSKCLFKECHLGSHKSHIEAHHYCYDLLFLATSSPGSWWWGALCKPMCSFSPLRNYANLPSRRTVPRSQNSSLSHVSCSRTNVEFHSGFSASSYLLFSHSVVSESVTPCIATHQASLSITIYCSFLKLMSIESVMQFSHLILFCPLLLLPLVFPSIRVFSNESVLHIG